MKEREESEWVSVLLLADFNPRKSCGNDHKYLFYAHSSLYRSVHIDRLHRSGWLKERIYIQTNPCSAAKVTGLLALKFSLILLLCKWYIKRKGWKEKEHLCVKFKARNGTLIQDETTETVPSLSDTPMKTPAFLLSGEHFVYFDFMFLCGCKPGEKQHIGKQCQACLDWKLNGVCCSRHC